MDEKERTVSGNVPEAVKEKVAQTLDPIIRKLPLDQQEEARETLMLAMMSYQGPLPPPTMLAEYGRVVPDFPERIVARWESETNHRHNSENRQQAAIIRASNLGQIIGAGLCVFFGSIAAVLGIYGHDWLAGTVFTTTIVAVIVVFVLGRMPNEKVETEKPARPSTSLTKKPNAKQKRR